MNASRNSNSSGDVDLRNVGVRLTLTGQDLVDALNRGDNEQAHELALQAADLAAHIAGELKPVGDALP